MSSLCLDTSAFSNFRRKAGTPVPTNDIWIAAAAARNGASVLTCDDHFERIGRVGSIVVEG